MKTSDFTPQAPGRLIQTPTGYTAYLPNPLPPALDLSPRLISALSQAESRLATLEEVGKSFPIPQRLARPFIRKEAVLSSQIDGIRTTFEALLSFETGLCRPGFDLIDARKVQNYVQALDFGLEQLHAQPFSTHLIRELHERLLEGIPLKGVKPGEFRSSQNRIEGLGATLPSAGYAPPSVPEMRKALVDLENFIHRGSELPDLIRIGLIHCQFQAIHPFSEGNGRVSRLLISLLLVAWGKLSLPLLNLSNTFEANRQAYHDHLLDVTQKGVWEKWLIFFLLGIAAQAEDTTRRIRQLTDLRNQYQRLFTDERSRRKLAVLVDYLIGTPITSIQQAQRTLQMGSYTTIQRQIEKLAALGIVREITGQERNRLYQADEILWILMEGEAK